MIKLSKSESIDELKTAIGQSEIRIVKPKTPLDSRIQAYEYIRNYIYRYKPITPIAVPVHLPSDVEYLRAIDHLHELNNRLKQAVRPWARKNIEQQIIKQHDLLRYMELQTVNKQPYWIVYLVDHNDKSISHRTRF